MRILTKLSSAVLIAVVFFTFSCQQKKENTAPKNEVPAEVLVQVKQMGFSDEGVIKADNGYIVEGDIFIPTRRLGEKPAQNIILRAGNQEQYHTTNTVASNGGRVITVYMGSGFDATYSAGLDEAVSRYNALNLDLTFQRVNSSAGADIKFTTLSFWLEWFGVLGSAGFPENNNPFGEIKMSRKLISTYGYTADGIATVMAHEMGHCIGFRHTDYMDRSISCGGSTNDEGDGGVGAIHIPGTPTNATVAAGSWMLACSGGGNRDFNADDITALKWMYQGNF